MLTVGSLFAGIGGFDLGFERAGMRTVWQVELDEFCREVLTCRFPHAVQFSDVRECGAHNLERVDVVCGGFPCQDISLAGKAAGIDGARSGLWGEYARIVRELRPRYVVVENVPALLARGMGRVLGDLAACGYDAEWDCIPASAVGAPHSRDRVWLVAYADGERREGSESEPAARGVTEPRGGGALADAERGAVGSGLRAGGPGGLGRRRSADSGGSLGGWWAVEPPVGRVADGLPGRVVRLRALGNAVVPQVAEWLGERIVRWESE